MVDGVRFVANKGGRIFFMPNNPKSRITFTLLDFFVTGRGRFK